ncbi:hypothetical protein BX600DRAFT_511128 [Xylariales sp. PMI_506]|nr:hypothetical protein BX600DRAFT_511128 [Xylariales sp. PMI_506]
MGAKLEVRGRARVADLPSHIPSVPQLDDHAVDVPAVARAFIDSFSTHIGTGDWEAFGDLFIEKSFWKDSLTLTFDKRTIFDRENIVSAWRQLAPARKPAVFKSEQDFGLGLTPTLQRLSPTLATIDVPLSFSTAAPATNCVGVAKLVPVGQGGWKIWILTTTVVSLTDYPFQPLPRKTPSSIPDNQRGKSQAQGLPQLEDRAVLDAVIIGGSCSGISNAIRLDSLGADVVAFETHPSAGGNWSAGGKEYVTLHHHSGMVALPGFPVLEGLPTYLPARDFTRFLATAVEELKLPIFCGVTVVSNTFDEQAKVWTTLVRDVATGAEAFIKSRNLVISTGFLLSPSNPKFPTMADRELFSGLVQHASEYDTTKEYKGKDVLVVGSANSAHDIARSLALGGAASVTMLQRSPTTLLSFEVMRPLSERGYDGSLPLDTADFLQQSMPTGIMRDMAREVVAMMMQAQPDLVAALESSGYLIRKDVCMISAALEERGRSLYMDQQKTFDLVFADRIKIARGEARRFMADGVIVYDQEQDQDKIIRADAVVYATGYKDIDLPQRYADSGFLDKKSAAMIENVNEACVDVEGELPGYFTNSGHPHLYFAGYGIIHNRWVSRYSAIQVMADVTGQFPDRLSR